MALHSPVVRLDSLHGQIINMIIIILIHQKRLLSIESHDLFYLSTPAYLPLLVYKEQLNAM